MKLTAYGQARLERARELGLGYYYDEYNGYYAIPVAEVPKFATQLNELGKEGYASRVVNAITDEGELSETEFVLWVFERDNADAWADIE